MTAFRKLSIFSTVTTFLLVGIGGLVRATKSGLGCGTDWPHCSGKLLPSLETRATVIEFSHRLTASVVVLLLATMAVLAWRNRREAPKLVKPSIAALVLVMSQAVLGAIVVKLELEAISVVLHLGTALSLLALLIYITAAAGVRDDRPSQLRDSGTSRAAAGVAGAVFLLLLLGSYVSGREAGFVFPDWPLMNGSLIPEFQVEEQAIHFLHRGLAAIVGFIVLAFVIQMTRRKREFPLAARLAHVGAGLFAVEVMIGALNVWTELNSIVVTFHLLIGALVWGSLVGVAVITSPALDRARARSEALGTSTTVAEQGA
jgi:cytochrome c oxidase assembly protein subunit 15